MRSRIALTTVLIAATGLINVAVAALPNPGVTIEPGRTALLITDPQNDFLSPDGVTWGVVGKSVTDNKTVENIDSLFRFIANTVWTTQEAVQKINGSK